MVLNYIERDVEKDLFKWLYSREIIAIRGPRQAGKTTLLKRIEKKLKNKINESNITYVSFEDDFEKVKFEKNPKQFIKFHLSKKKHFFLFDEIQYVNNAGKILKLIFDSFKNIKIIVTGSSSLDLTQIGSFLVGRVVFFELFPFNFSEFLKSKNKKLFNHFNEFKFNKNKIKESIFLNELNELLKEYIIFGGYPRVVLEKSIEKKKIILKNLILTYLEKDIVGMYSPKYKTKIIESTKYLSECVGSMIKYEDISKNTGLSFNEVKEIISVLESTYIIKSLKPFHKNLVTELKKNPKIYFIDSGLRNAVIEKFDFSNQEYGYLLENFVFQQLLNKKINYWRTTAKAEIDFIEKNNLTPIEVKSIPKITRGLRSFIKTYNPKTSFILNLTKYNEIKINNCKIIIFPISLMDFKLI